MSFDWKNPVVVAGLAFVLGVSLIAAGHAAAGCLRTDARPPRPAPADSVLTPSIQDAPGLAGTALPLVLGGFRGLVADIAWLRVQLAWEREDEAGVLRWSEFASTVDPGALPFWINSARMLAYDLADVRWRDAQANGGAIMALRLKIDEEQAQKALRRLERGVRWLPSEARLWIEMGNIHLNRRNDAAAAAGCYARAIALPGAPAYAGRIHAGLLWQVGRHAEAVTALRNHLETLKSADRTETDPFLISAVEARLAAWQVALEGIQPE